MEQQQQQRQQQQDNTPIIVSHKPPLTSNVMSPISHLPESSVVVPSNMYYNDIHPIVPSQRSMNIYHNNIPHVVLSQMPYSTKRPIPEATSSQKKKSRRHTVSSSLNIDTKNLPVYTNPRSAIVPSNQFLHSPQQFIVQSHEPLSAPIHEPPITSFATFQHDPLYSQDHSIQEPSSTIMTSHTSIASHLHSSMTVQSQESINTNVTLSSQEPMMTSQIQEPMHILHHHQETISSPKTDIIEKKLNDYRNMTKEELIAKLMVLEKKSLKLPEEDESEDDLEDDDHEEEEEAQSEKKSIRIKCKWHQCTEAFQELQALITHVTEKHIGSGKPTYCCEWEGCPRNQKPFTKRHKMYNHLRTHTGERPFVCEEPTCGKKFSRLDSLATHIKTHSSVRPYACHFEGCDKAYYHSRSLKKHEKTHEPSFSPAGLV